MYLLLCNRMDACFHRHQDKHVALRDISRGRNASAAVWEYAKQVYGGMNVASLVFDPVEKVFILGHVAQVLQPRVVLGSRADMQITLSDQHEPTSCACPLMPGLLRRTGKRRSQLFRPGII